MERRQRAGHSPAGHRRLPALHTWRSLHSTPPRANSSLPPAAGGARGAAQSGPGARVAPLESHPTAASAPQPRLPPRTSRLHPRKQIAVRPPPARPAPRRLHPRTCAPRPPASLRVGPGPGRGWGGVAEKAGPDGNSRPRLPEPRASAQQPAPGPEGARVASARPGGHRGARRRDPGWAGGACRGEGTSAGSGRPASRPGLAISRHSSA